MDRAGADLSDRPGSTAPFVSMPRLSLSSFVERLPCADTESRYPGSAFPCVRAWEFQNSGFEAILVSNHLNPRFLTCLAPEIPTSGFRARACCFGCRAKGHIGSCQAEHQLEYWRPQLQRPSVAHYWREGLYSGVSTISNTPLLGPYSRVVWVIHWCA